MAAKKAAKKIRIELIKSCIGRNPKHVKTVRALGLGKINSKVEKDSNPAILGMVKSIAYLLKVEEI